MKTTFLKIALLSIGMSLFCSCSFQKRSYLKGYAVEWNFSQHNSSNSKTACATKDTLIEVPAFSRSEVKGQEVITRVAFENSPNLSSSITANSLISRKDSVIRARRLTKVNKQKSERHLYPSTSKAYEQYEYYKDDASEIKDYSIAALVSSLVGIVIWPMGFAAIVLSIVTLEKYSRSIHKNRSAKLMAVLAIILGVLELLASVTLVIALLSIF